MPYIDKIGLITETTNIYMEKECINTEQTQKQITQVNYKKFNVTLEDIWKIANNSSIHINLALEILSESNRLSEIYNNPYKFSEQVTSILREVKSKTIIDGIYYIKNNDEEYYLQEVFDANEIIAYLDKNAVEMKNNKTPYDYIIYDSETVEKPFAKALDNDPTVKMFFKFPPKI